MKTKKLTATAMFCAIAFVTVALGRIPVVLFLSYDPKDIVIALGGLIWGPLTACLISVVVSLIEMVTISDTGVIGLIMNILSTCSFACTASYIYKKKHSLKGAFVGLVMGSIAMICVMLLWNYLITPLYMNATRDEVVNLLLPVFLPFNLIKAGLNAGFTFLLYRPVISALRKSGFIERSTSRAPKKTSWGTVLVASVIIITCILFVLSFNGII